MSFTRKAIVVSLCIAVGFFAGLLVKAHKSFESGYRYAYSEITNLLVEGYDDKRDFYISGLAFKFRPQADKKALQFSIAGIGDEGIRKVYRGR